MSGEVVVCFPHIALPTQNPAFFGGANTNISKQNLGPLLEVKRLVGYMSNRTKLKGAKGIRLT